MNVDFVIPALNAEKTIFQCINSILSLNLSEIKANVILVDNGSTDRTVSIAQGFPSVTVLTCKKRGRSFARNAGAVHSTAEYIAFIDSDIVLDPDWLLHLVKLFNNVAIGMVQGQIISAGLDDSLTEFRLQRKNFSTMGTFVENESPELQLPLINTAACIVRSSFLRNISYFNTDLVRSEDLDLTLRLCVAGSSFAATFAAKAYVYYDGSRASYLLRAFSVSYYQTRFAILNLGLSKDSVLSSIVDERYFICKTQYVFSFLYFLLSSLGSLGALLLYPGEGQSFNIQFQQAKSNLAIPPIVVSGVRYRFSYTKRFYLSERSLLFYGIFQKREMRLYGKNENLFFRKLLQGDLTKGEIINQDDFLKLLIAEKVLVQDNT